LRDLLPFSKIMRKSKPSKEAGPPSAHLTAGPHRKRLALSFGVQILKQGLNKFV
jgi:hypothetical protein